MQATIELPKAFSVQNDQEFFAFQHLMARMNPKLMVRQVATGRHVRGGGTVFWGLVYKDGQDVTVDLIRSTLEDAGFDASCGLIQGLPLVNGCK